MEWRRVRLKFTPDLEVEFVDRDRALRQVEEFAKRGTYPVYVIYGPEGCGKTALFKQAIEILKAYDYSVVYVSPLEELENRFTVTEDLKDIVKEILKTIVELTHGRSVAKLVDLAICVVSRALKHGRKRVAILADDIFQAVDLDKAELYVKTFLNLIEHPSADYDRIVILVGSSEGVSRTRVGRHSWAELWSIWNMSREGLRELYSKLPGDKPPFDDVWRWTGGNPRYLGRLYIAGWNVDKIVHDIIEERDLLRFVKKLGPEQRKILEEAVEDPDILFQKLGESENVNTLIDKLVELNLVMCIMPERDEYLWIDVPPPEKDPEIGIGRYVAWQTPMHREAIRKALQCLV